MNSQIKQADIAPANTIVNALNESLGLQRQAYLDDPVPDVAQRKQDLLSLKKMLSENSNEILEAINQDYGNRSKHESMFAEVLVTLDGINFVLKNMKRWMKVQHRAIDITMYPGARNRVIPQPLGVVGIIVPWNFPIQLSFAPLTSIFAAGNRAMVKMSENSRHLSHLLMEISPKYFPLDKLRFFEETGEVGIQFSQLPFDHLLFTGSGATGKAVMASAAKNLTPVTLELGGKSPAVIDQNYSMKKAVERILFVKTYNAGQACVSVDYIFIPENRIDEFVSEAQAWINTHCPDINSIDYTSIIDQSAYERLQQALEDARKHDATVINLTEGQESAEGMRKIGLHLVLDPKDEMILLQREIFGPILPILSYTDPRQVVEYINLRDRPLSFYPFTNDKNLQNFYLDKVMSGGCCINDAMLHVAQHDLPFGGVGASGMGHYHGFEGFVTFSKLRPVYYQAGFSAMKYLAPPYGKLANKAMDILLKLKS